VLFFAGLSCDIQIFSQYYYAIGVVGTGHLVLTTGLFALVGWASGLCEGIGSVTFFGVACCLSSRQLMTEHLDRVQQVKTMHGRLLLGLAFFQDITAILAFSILWAFDQTVIDLDAATAKASWLAPILAANASAAEADTATSLNQTLLDTASSAARALSAGGGRAEKGGFDQGRDAASPLWLRRGGANFTNWDPPENMWHDRFRLGNEIGKQVGLLVVCALVFALLNRYVLERLFRFFTVDGEMLFIGTMAYNLGAAAICSQCNFSPLVGSYVAGLSLSLLPSRVQIQNKVASLRGFGMTIFYFMMGIYVHLSADFFRTNFALSLLVTGLNVIISPLFIWAMGYVAGLKSRTTIYTSFLSNSLGETTLTLQVLPFHPKPKALNPKPLSPKP